MTLRELVDLAEARNRHCWDHTSQILSAIHNANISKRSQALRPDAFHPYQSSGRPIPLTPRESVLHLAAKLLQ